MENGNLTFKVASQFFLSKKAAKQPQISDFHSPFSIFKAPGFLPSYPGISPPLFRWQIDCTPLDWNHAHSPLRCCGGSALKKPIRRINACATTRCMALKIVSPRKAKSWWSIDSTQARKD